MFNTHLDYNVELNFGQVLSDISPSGRERPWREKKLKSEMLALIYESVNRKKSARLLDCADFLIFNTTVSGRLKLKSMNSCRVRLCPMCAWRRSLKIYSNMTKIMNEVKKDNNLSYLFATFTVKNVYAAELSDTITFMMSGYKRLMESKKVSSVVKGWYRGLEITYNDNNDTYHPHFHCVFAVNRSYFKHSDKYLTQKDWTSLWMRSMKLDYVPVCDVRRVYGDSAKAVSEIAKYTVKDSDYIKDDDIDLSVDIVKCLDSALNKRRLVAYGGLFKELHKQLNLDDEMDGDLVHVDCDELDEVTEKEVVFFWNVGFGNYFIK